MFAQNKRSSLDNETSHYRRDFIPLNLTYVSLSHSFNQFLAQPLVYSLSLYFFVHIHGVWLYSTIQLFKNIFCYVHGSVHRESMSIIVQQDATIYSFIIFLQTALHVSDETLIHHQEHTQNLITTSGNGRTVFGTVH